MKWMPGVLVAVLGLSAAAGCGAVGSSGSGPQVVASFYPLAYVAERVAGSHVEVENLTSPGVEPHDLELTPQQVADLSEAELVVFERGFQPAVDEAVEQNSPDATLDVTEVVELESSEKEEASTDDGDDHAGLEGDPHIWLDPTLMIPVAEKVADDLAEIDPDHAADFRASAADLIDDLEQLDSEFAEGLAQCERSTFVTSHAAFGYLAHRYGLDMAPIAGLSPDAEPSPQQLSEISDLIESEGITTVFSEALGSQEYADTLANDLGVRTAVLDPIEGLTDEDSSDDYLSLMRDNLSALREANGCA